MSLFGDFTGFLSSGRAAKSVSNADIAAEHGVLGATADAQAGIGNALTGANQLVPAAGENAIADVNAGAFNSNQSLADLYHQITAGTSPYTTAGEQGVQGLADYAASKPQFSFNLDDYFNSPAYNFQLAQGQNAITNQASAQGLSQGGNVLRDLTSFGQGLASTYYDQAFKQAQSTFNTNQNATLANLSSLINAGEFGTAVNTGAGEKIGAQQAQNTFNAGLYSGNTNTSLAQFLSSLNLGGAEASGSFGLQGSKLAGDYAVGAGQANAKGILNQGAALTSGVSDLGTLLAQLGIGGGH